MTDRFEIFARDLVAAHRERARFRSFSAEYGIRNLDDAYDAQEALTALRMGTAGDRSVGYKIGLTSLRMQEMCGIPHPIAGTVLAGGVRESGARLDPAQYGRLGIEFEIAVRLGHDLPLQARPYEMAEISAAVDAVAPAIEIIDDRNADYASLDPLSLVADNSWNAGIVLGPFSRNWPDLPSLAGTVLGDGKAFDQGTGADVLGHPFAPLAWLANHLATRGAGLTAGDIVMTGSIVTTKFPAAGETYRFELAGLGAVEAAIG
ncbi:MAG TPA: fumarylacetoacetate hydrolase family protein [Aliidongia sp.]|nr:fumarylacetoacetate hydrolase family protein [Aliidongia sp.]